MSSVTLRSPVDDRVDDGDELADKWVSLPNRNAIFHGQAPLDYMLDGGLPAMQTVRMLLDARRGGL